MDEASKEHSSITLLSLFRHSYLEPYITQKLFTNSNSLSKYLENILKWEKGVLEGFRAIRELETGARVSEGVSGDCY